MTHQEDMLTLEPEEDTDFNDNKETKSGKSEMSEIAGGRRRVTLTVGRATGLDIRGEAFRCGW